MNFMLSVVLISAVPVFIVILRSMRGFRTTRLREEFIAFLKNYIPEIKISNVSKSLLEIEYPPFGRIQCNLADLYDMFPRRLPVLEVREEIYNQYLHDLEARSMEQIPKDEFVKRIYPRLLHMDMLHEYSAGGSQRVRPLSKTPLLVAYIVDFRCSVLRLNQEWMEKFELTASSLNDIAMSNLRGISTKISFRLPLEKNQSLYYTALAGLSAERLLLVPEFLQPGEEMAAGVPDKETLLLWPVPPDGNWQPLMDDLAKTEKTPICPHPLRVSCDGFCAVDASGAPLQGML